MAQTWHQVRPGEVRVDCGGCHYHSHQPIPWAGSLAAQRPPSIPAGVRNVTWLNRIAALVGRIQGTLRGVALGSLAPDAAFDCIADDRSGDCSPSQLAERRLAADQRERLRQPLPCAPLAAVVGSHR